MNSVLLIMLTGSDCIDELGLCTLLDRSLAFLDIENRAPVTSNGCKLYVCAGQFDFGMLSRTLHFYRKGSCTILI